MRSLRTENGALLQIHLQEKSWNRKTSNSAAEYKIHFQINRFVRHICGHINLSPSVRSAKSVEPNLMGQISSTQPNIQTLLIEDNLFQGQNKQNQKLQEPFGPYITLINSQLIRSGKKGGKKKRWQKELLTTGSGASSCLHITHGTPVF